MLYKFTKGATIWRTKKKNISDVFMDRVPTLRTVRKYISQFPKCWLQKGTIHSDQSSGFYNDLIRDLVKNDYY